MNTTTMRKEYFGLLAAAIDHARTNPALRSVWVKRARVWLTCIRNMNSNPKSYPRKRELPI